MNEPPRQQPLCVGVAAAKAPDCVKLEVTLRPATDVLHLQTAPPTHPSDPATTHQPAGGEKSLN